MNSVNRLVQKIIWGLIPSGPAGDALRGQTYRRYLLSCGANFKVGEAALIYKPEQLVVGDNVYIGFSAYLGNGEIVLGNEVLIGNHVSITPSNHVMNNRSFRFGGSRYSAIEIGDGSWVGAHSCVLAGVKIGRGSLVAAGSVVTRSVPDFVVVAGVPAKIIKHLSPE